MSRRNNPTVNEQSGYLVFQTKKQISSLLYSDFIPFLTK